MRVTVLFLGPARDFAGIETTSVELLRDTTVADLRRLLSQRFPSLAPAMNSIRFAINEAFGNDQTVLGDGDEVALIPPVSGGQDDRIWVDLFEGMLPADRVRAFVVSDEDLGGIVTFEGATRAEANATHGRLVRLEYEVYSAMALKQMRSLADTATERWSAGRVAVVHRIGPVPPGEASVIIAVACPHRAEAFEACRWLIDTLKRDVPIWKKDVFADGFVRWVDAASNVL